MQAADAGWVFSDLDRAGLLTAVQVERPVASGRNPRGHRVETPTPIGVSIGVHLTTRRETLVRAGFGEHAEVTLVAVCPPGQDVRVEDQLVALDGPRAGQRFRVVTVPEGEAIYTPVLAGLVRMRGG